MREHAQLRNDVLDALYPFFDVVKNLGVFSLLLGREILALVAKGEKAGRREVQRVIDFMNNTGAHATKGSEFFGLHQLRLGVLELVDGRFERLVLLRKLALVLVG